MQLDTASKFRGESLVGRKFTRLTVTEYAGKGCQGAAYWKCLCDCENTIVTRGATLIQNQSRSCGCFQKDMMKFVKRTSGYKHRLRSMDDVFWVHVDKNGEIPKHNPKLGKCWKWTGSKYSQGYGRTSRGDTIFLAHRLSWEIHNGSIPDGRFICHHCDNPECTNPDHLYLGDHDSNMRDCRMRFLNCPGGREWDGPKKTWDVRGKGDTRRKHSKITPETVSEIRKAYSMNVGTYDDLARMFALPRTTIFSALNKWKNLKTVCSV